MAVKAKIGVLVMALLEDDYNKTAHMRPAATAAAQEIADALAEYGDVVHAGLVEEEAAGRGRRAPVQRRGRRHHRRPASWPTPRASCRPAACWTPRPRSSSGTPSGSGGSARTTASTSSCSTAAWPGMPELTALLLRTEREFALITSPFDDPDGRRRVQRGHRCGSRPATAARCPDRPGRPSLRGHDRPHVRRPLAAPGHRPGGLAPRAREGRPPLRRDPAGRRRRDDGRRAGPLRGGDGARPLRALRPPRPGPRVGRRRSTASTPSPPSTRSG